MCPALSHRGISSRDFASLSDYQSSVCCCTLLLPGLWTLTSHLSKCFSFIGLDFDIFFPRQYPPKCWEAACMQMFMPEASPPLKAKENVDSLADSSQETQSSPLHAAVLTLASSGAQVWGGRLGWAFPSALPGGDCFPSPSPSPPPWALSWCLCQPALSTHQEQHKNEYKQTIHLLHQKWVTKKEC